MRLVLAEHQVVDAAVAGLHRGTLAQMVAMIRAMPEDDRSKYVIYKDNDHMLTLPEVMALAARSDFPLRGA